MARTIEFNREDVLESALKLFWEQGYTQTSIPSLVKATKLNPGSIYAAFDSKEGLFIETMAYYGNASLATLKQTLENAESPLAGITSFLHSLIEKTTQGDNAGCLVVNALLEMAAHNSNIQAQANKQLEAVEQLLKKTIIEAQALGELAPQDDPSVLAKTLMIHIWGLRVLAKTGVMQQQTQAAKVLLAQLLKGVGKLAD